VLLVSAFLVVALPALGAETVELILSHVNSRIITQSAFDARYEQVVHEAGPPPNAARADDMRKTLFNTLVDEALLEDRGRDMDLVTTDKEVEERIRQLKEENKLTSDAEFEKVLEGSGLTIQKLRDQLRNSIMVQRVVGREVQSKVDLTDDALRAIYEREKQNYQIPERARLAEILALRPRGTDPNLVPESIRSAVDAFRSGAKFEDVVRRFSEGSTKDRGGDLGWVARGELLPEIDRVVFALPVGAVSDPISTKIGWHLVKVLEKQPVSYRPFSEVKAEILKREQETQFQKKLAEYLEKLKREAVIRVSPQAAAYYTAPPPAVRELSASAAAAADAAYAVEGAGARQTVEIAAFAGYRIGGTASPQGNTYIDRVGIPSSLSFGAAVEYPLSDKWHLEALWDHQKTSLKVDFTGTPLEGGNPERKISDLSIDTIQLGILVQSGSSDERARLFADVLLGATILSPSAPYSGVTKFSLSVGAGAKYWLTEHFGGRFAIRWMPVYLNSTSSGYSYCDPIYGCYAYWNNNYLSQGDASLGVIYKF
jgi:peptidyl-prolyl cis-trans isomerase SurA